MISYLLAGPATEPVSLAEAKAYLRVDDAAEDGLIETLVTSARLHVEATSGRALLTQSWRAVLDAWPAEREVRLPVTPVAAITAVTAHDEAGTGHALPLDQFEAGPDRLLLPASIAGMPALRPRLGIEIDYIAGHGDDPAAVPADLRQALLLLVGTWFEHRDSAVAPAPAGVDRLLGTYRAVRL